MDTYEKAKSEVLKCRKALNKADGELEDIISKKELPRLRKKYNGKCFKYKNCYSCPEKPSDYWWLYIRVEKGMSEQYGKVLSFQTDKYGKINIEKEKHTSLPDLGYVKISNEEFNKQFDLMLNKIKRLRNNQWN